MGFLFWLVSLLGVGVCLGSCGVRACCLNVSLAIVSWTRTLLCATLLHLPYHHQYEPLRGLLLRSLATVTGIPAARDLKVCVSRHVPNTLCAPPLSHVSWSPCSLCLVLCAPVRVGIVPSAPISRIAPVRTFVVEGGGVSVVVS